MNYRLHAHEARILFLDIQPPLHQPPKAIPIHLKIKEQELEYTKRSRKPNQLKHIAYLLSSISFCLTASIRFDYLQMDL